MKNIKRVYYYFFYKLYNHYEDSSAPWWSDFKASASLGALEIWFLLSIFNYFLLITGKTTGELTLMQPFIFIPIILIFLLHYVSFMHTDVWKEYNKEFDQFSKEKNKKNSLITWCIIILIILNTIFSYYLLFERAKRNQTGPFSKEYIEQQEIKDSIDNAKYNKEMQDIRDDIKK